MPSEKEMLYRYSYKDLGLTYTFVVNGEMREGATREVVIVIPFFGEILEPYPIPDEDKVNSASNSHHDPDRDKDDQNHVNKLGI